MGNAAPDTSGLHVTRLRLAAGLSARQLATKAGVSTSCVHRAESGRAVTRDVLAKLASILGPSIYDAVPLWPPVPAGDNAVARARRQTGEALTEAASRAGVSDDVMKRAERGQGVHPKNAKAIAEAFGLDVMDVSPTREADKRDAA